MKACKLHVAYFIAMSLILFWACNEISPIDAANLAMNASNYHGKLVTLQGCFVKKLEMAVIGPCLKPETDKLIWIEPYSKIEWLLQHNPNYGKNFIKRERGLSEKEKALAEQFANIPYNSPRHVVVQGEFRFLATPEFADNGNHRYELILHRVLSISSYNKKIH
jgi:hypothetical protein